MGEREAGRRGLVSGGGGCWAGRAWGACGTWRGWGWSRALGQAIATQHTYARGRVRPGRGNLGRVLFSGLRRHSAMALGLGGNLAGFGSVWTIVDSSPDWGLWWWRDGLLAMRGWRSIGMTRRRQWLVDSVRERR